MSERFIGASPMWCSRGHHESNSSVKTRKARSTPVFTVIVLRTALSFVASVTVVISSSPFSRAALLRPVLEGGKRLRPELIEVVAQGVEAGRVDPIEPAVSGGGVLHEPGVLEHAQVLRDRRPADREVPGQDADGERPLAQPRQD